MLDYYQTFVDLSHWKIRVRGYISFYVVSGQDPHTRLLCRWTYVTLNFLFSTDGV